VGKEGFFISLDSGRKLLVVAGQKDASSLEQGDPAADLQGLAAFVDYDQIEDLFGEVASEDPVGCSYVRAAKHLGVLEDLLDDLFLSPSDLVLQLFYLSVE
jgi:hypothetical protein